MPTHIEHLMPLAVISVCVTGALCSPTHADTYLPKSSFYKAIDLKIVDATAKHEEWTTPPPDRLAAESKSVLLEPSKPGEYVTFEFAIEGTGNYKIDTVIFAYLDQGVYNVRIDGKPVATEWDYSIKPWWISPTMYFTRGIHLLSLEYTKPGSYNNRRNLRLNKLFVEGQPTPGRDSTR